MSLNGEMLEGVDHFRYLWSQIGLAGGVEVDVSFRVVEARRVDRDTVTGRNVGLERSKRGGSWIFLRWGV